MILKKGYLTALLILIMVFLSACSSKEQQQVRIGYFTNLTHAQALEGKAKGSFTKAFGRNAKVKWLEFNAGFSEVEAMLSGDIDIGYIGPGPAIGGYIKSKGGLQIIAGAVNGGAILVARENAPIHSVKDLDGKRVAIPQFGNTQDLALRDILQRNGLKSTASGGTVDILQAENSDIKTYLARNYIDAALLPEPWGSRLIQEIQAKIVLDSNQIMLKGNYPTTVVIVRKAFLQEHPDLVQKFLAAHIELTGEIAKNPEETKELINQEIKKTFGKSLGSEVLDSAFPRLKVTYNLDRDGVEEFIDILVRSKYVRKRPDTSQLVNLEPLNEALEEEQR